MKKFVSVILSLVLLALTVVSAGASGEYVFDDYGYLQEKSILDDIAEEIYEKSGYIASCYITASIEGMNGNEQAQRVFEEKFGGSEGILLLDCVDTKNYYIYFSQKINDAFAQEDALSLFKAYDSQTEYDASVSSFLNTAKELLLSLSDKADTSEAPVELIPENRVFSRVVDQVGVLGQNDISKLNSYADSISEQYKCDVAAVFVNSTEGKDVQACADDFYDYNGYGYGENDDGILLLVAVGDREYAVTTYGYGTRAFSDGSIDLLTDRFIGYLSESRWSDAALEFITGCGEILYRSAYEPQYTGSPAIAAAPEIDPLSLIAINIAVGLIIGFLVVGGMKRKHKSVIKKVEANEYLRSGSFQLTYSNDRFIRSAVSRMKKPEPQNRTPGGFSGGGGSVHFSSSGRPHGGSSGKF